jgi:putative transposase
MREDNLLNLQRLFDTRNQNFEEQFEVYLNLAARIRVTGINQLWVADITYVCLKFRVIKIVK